MPTMMPLTQPTSPSSYAPSIYPLTPSDTVTRQKTFRRKSAFKIAPVWLVFSKKGRAQGQTAISKRQLTYPAK
jgi:hypothetical protein